MNYLHFSFTLKGPRKRESNNLRLKIEGLLISNLVVKEKNLKISQTQPKNCASIEVNYPRHQINHRTVWIFSSKRKKKSETYNRPWNP